MNIFLKVSGFIINARLRPSGSDGSGKHQKVLPLLVSLCNCPITNSHLTSCILSATIFLLASFSSSSYILFLAAAASASACYFALYSASYNRCAFRLLSSAAASARAFFLSYSSCSSLSCASLLSASALLASAAS